MTTDIIRRVTFDRQKKRNFPSFSPGDTIGVYVKVREFAKDSGKEEKGKKAAKDADVVKERLQLFKGVVIKIQGSGAGRTFTVRKISSGVGVERTFPFSSPSVDKVEIYSTGKVRRGKLYYLRGLKGRASRLNSDLVYTESENAAGAEATDTDSTTEKSEQ